MVCGVIIAENVLRLVPKNTHSWDKFVSPEAFKRMLKDNNCNVALIYGMKYEFWRDHCEWSSCMDINYAMHAIKDY